MLVKNGYFVEIFVKKIDNLKIDENRMISNDNVISSI